MSHRFSAIDDGIFISGQVELRDITDLRNCGFAWLVNHRPDGEEPGQPTSKEVEHVAAAAGLNVVSAPVRGLPDEAAVAATAQAMRALPPGQKMLMFCRSGMRSSAAWAMARALEGAPADELRAKAAAAGYDLSRLPL